MADIATRAHAFVHRRGSAVILFAMCLGVFVAQLDSQVVNLAIKRIGADLAAGISQLQWVLNSYNLLYATLLLTTTTRGFSSSTMRSGRSRSSSPASRVAGIPTRRPVSLAKVMQWLAAEDQARLLSAIENTDDFGFVLPK